MSSTDAVEYLHNLPQFANVADEAYEPGLERMQTLMEAMGRPHDSLRAIHIAGTNGKGSVASMVAAIATAAGLRTGLHTSPHLTHLTQRMRIDGTPAPREWLEEAVHRYQPLFERVEASFFEATVALTFLYFAEKDVDLAVIEVGLGGRLDATNVLRPALSLITSIDLDHTELLGDTIEAVAREKAGIIKPQAPVITGVTQDEAREAIAEIAAEQSVPLHVVQDETQWRAPHADLSGSVLDLETPVRPYDRLRLSLPGAHQQANAALAVRAAELAFPSVQATPEPVYAGLSDIQKRTGFRGRLDVLQSRPLIVVDVGHNPPAIAASLETVSPIVTKRGGTLYVLLNMPRDKGIAEVAELLADRMARVTPIPIDTRRALSPEEMRETLRAHGVITRPSQPVEEAIREFQQTASPEDGLLLVGSHKLVEILPDPLRSKA